MAKVAVHPEADLATRPGAVEPTQDELKQLALFAELQRQPDIRKYPDSMVLRRIAKGEVICHQGEAGASAFYILTTEDVLLLKKHQRDEAAQLVAGAGEAGRREPEVVEAGKLAEQLGREIAQLETRGQQLEDKPSHDPARAVAAALLMVDSPGTRGRRSGGFLATLKNQFFGNATPTVKQPKYIPIDGPTDVDYQTRRAPLFEGDIFGEMSCLSFAPRSATVVAEADCYLLEFLRSIFDQIQRDKAYQARTEKIYRDRALEGHFSRMELFHDVNKEDLDYVRERAQLEVFEPGTVICDEGDTADCVYLIRSGLVQIVMNANVLLADDDILDWPRLLSELVEAAPKPTADEAKEKPAAGQGKSSTLDALKAKLAAKSEASSTATAATQQSATPASAPKSAVEKLKARLAAKGGLKGQQPADEAAMTGADAASTPDAQPAKPATPSGPPQSPRLADLMNHVAAKSEAKRKQLATRLPPPGDARKQVADPKDPKPAAEKKTVPAKSPALAALTGKAKPAKPVGSPKEKVWRLLPPDAHNAIRAADADPTAGSERPIIIAALNKLIQQSAFVTSAETKELRERHAALAPARNFGKAEKYWTGMEVRVAGRLLLQAIFPECLRARAQGKPPRILAYLSRGDIFGEIGVLDPNNRRTATAIAYDHPPDASGRRPSRLEMVRIDKEVFLELLNRSESVRQRVERLQSAREQRSSVAKQEQPWERDALVASSEFRDMGFAQGERLLLIDLDRCTRCGDCVRACINTHDDGFTRLFLDGPRFDRFLVPSACRNCRNPACMIGCPVGSIQRGDNGEILIRDWCIGCGMCAEQCPYDSIQMHDTGIIPTFALGWQYLPAAAVSGDRWRRPGFRADKWVSTIAPIYCDLDFADALCTSAGGKPSADSDLVYFRYAFQPSRRDRTGSETMSLAIESKASAVEVWLNGQPVEVGQDAKQKKKGEFTASAPARLLRRGENVVAVAVTLPVAEGDPVLSLRLDNVPQLEAIPQSAAEAEAKLVTQTAVVCDLCSSLPSKEPACVAQCPHDAAFRIDALNDFSRVSETT